MISDSSTRNGCSPNQYMMLQIGHSVVERTACLLWSVGLVPCSPPSEPTSILSGWTNCPLAKV